MDKFHTLWRLLHDERRIAEVSSLFVVGEVNPDVPGGYGNPGGGGGEAPDPQGPGGGETPDPAL